ncbi:hypothetical protein D6825_02615 [Candidatus Woesearchaeota archaeon]|nr:MAG: hypothetical protein D6825_02615 [Candidatus Woesearchaeota archaeon]
MRITIDTKTDSPEDIRKAIHFLNQFLAGIPAHEEPQTLSNMMGIFDNPEQNNQPDQEKKSEDDDLGIKLY